MSSPPDVAYAEGRLRIMSPKLATAVAGALAALALARSFYVRTVWLPGREFDPQSLYGELFRDLSRRGLGAPRVADTGIVKPGMTADGVAKDYAPQLDFYRLRADAEGIPVARVAPEALGRAAPGTLLATCDPRLTPQLGAGRLNLTEVHGCVAVRR